MAQALIAGRAEQAYLEDRSRANERRVEKLRRETLRLRAVLERWHGDFVASLPLQARQVGGCGNSTGGFDKKVPNVGSG